MGKLVDILEEEGIDFDIAAVSAYREKRDKEFEIDPCKDPKVLRKLYFGASLNENEIMLPPFYKRPEYAGVARDIVLKEGWLPPISAHAERINESPEKKEQKHKEGEKTLVEKKKQARKGMRDLAEELYGLVE